MQIKQNFKKNLKKLMKERGFKSHAEFGAAVGMSANKIQRLADCNKENQTIDLEDASKIAVALGTTLGHMTGAISTEKLITRSKTMHKGIVGALNYLEKDLILRNRRIAELKHDRDFIEEMLVDLFPLDKIKKDTE